MPQLAAHRHAHMGHGRQARGRSGRAEEETEKAWLVSLVGEDNLMTSSRQLFSCCHKRRSDLQILIARQHGTPHIWASA